MPVLQIGVKVLSSGLLRSSKELSALRTGQNAANVPTRTRSTKESKIQRINNLPATYCFSFHLFTIILPLVLR
jgi:hypothetical protein